MHDPPSHREIGSVDLNRGARCRPAPLQPPVSTCRWWTRSSSWRTARPAFPGPGTRRPFHWATADASGFPTFCHHGDRRQPTEPALLHRRQSSRRAHEKMHRRIRNQRRVRVDREFGRQCRRCLTFSRSVGSMPAHESTLPRSTPSADPTPLTRVLASTLPGRSAPNGLSRTGGSPKTPQVTRISRSGPRVDHVLTVQFCTGFQNRKAPENINVFGGLSGCGGRI